MLPAVAAKARAPGVNSTIVYRCVFQPWARCAQSQLGRACAAVPWLVMLLAGAQREREMAHDHSHYGG